MGVTQEEVFKDPGPITRRSSVMMNACDRRGYSELFTAEGRSILLPTTCKTWGCVVCRRKLLALFRARVEHGVLILGQCSFITITYQAESVRLRDAGCVQRDWTALQRNLRRGGRRWKWLKVVELTKQRIPHHHVILGPIGPSQEVRCHGKRIKKGAETARYLRRLDTCMCLSHVFAREWVSITGDSFMCYATAVTSAVGAGGYLGKYMDKTFIDGNRRWKGRRFTTSRDWPGG